MYRRVAIFLAVIVVLGCFLLDSAAMARACDVTEYSLDGNDRWKRLD